MPSSSAAPKAQQPNGVPSATSKKTTSSSPSAPPSQAAQKPKPAGAAAEAASATINDGGAAPAAKKQAAKKTSKGTQESTAPPSSDKDAATAAAAASGEVAYNFYKPPVNGRNIKPDEAERIAALALVEEEMKRAKAERDEVSRLMNVIKEAGKEGQEERSRIRAAQTKVREELTSTRGARDILFQKEKDLKQKFEDLKAEEKKLREGVRFSTVDEIDAEVARLEFRQQTEHLPLKDEKLLIQQIEKVRASKKLIGALQAKKAEVAKADEERKLASAEVNEKRAATDKLQAQFDGMKKNLAALDPPSDKLADLKARYERASKRMDDVYQKRQVIFTAWKAANDTFYQAEQERRRLLDEKRKTEQEAYLKQKEGERLAKEKAREEEELKESLKKPWTMEIAYCDFLIQYMNKLQGNETVSAATVSSATAATGKPKREVANPNLKPLVKPDDEYFPAKESVTKAKAAVPQPKAKTLFSHSTDVISTFGYLNLIPPVGPAQLEAKLAEVKAKRDYYDVLPRPAKASSAKSDKASNGGDAAAHTNGKSADGGIVVDNPEVFPQLRTTKESKGSSNGAGAWSSSSNASPNDEPVVKKEAPLPPPGL